MEKRLHPRQPLAFNFVVRDALSGKPLGRLGDISDEGLLIFGPAPLSPSHSMQVVLDLPGETASGRIYFHVQVRWSNAEAHEGSYDSGLRVLGLADPAVLAQMQELKTLFSAQVGSAEDPRALRP